MTHEEKRELAELLEEKVRRGPAIQFLPLRELPCPQTGKVRGLGEKFCAACGTTHRVWGVRINPAALDRSLIAGRETLGSSTGT
jgi:hypothetical protein